MSNNTTSSPQTTLVIPSYFEYAAHKSCVRCVDICTSIVIAVLSLVAVVGNALILAAIWKKYFARTLFHIILSGLAFTDLCTGLISQPLYVTSTIVYLESPRMTVANMATARTVDAVGDSSTIYFISITVLLVAFMSTERWLYMSQRSLITFRRGCVLVAIMLLIPIPIVACRVLWHPQVIMALFSIVIVSCYLTTSFFYFKVYRIILLHQQQVQANETQNFGQAAISLAKYKKSVATILCIVLLFSFSFLPIVITFRINLTFESNFALNRMSIALLFSSSSLNPGLYPWRMNHIRNGVRRILCRDS